MRRLVAGFALLSSVAAFLFFAGGGLFLLAVKSSGERGAGALLALGSLVAFAAAMVLVFARKGAFTRGAGRAGAVIAALLGVLPMGAISAGALRFSGFPYGSATPGVVWPVFAAGLLFALGGVALLVLGYLRVREKPAARARPEVVVRPVQQPAEALRPAKKPARRPAAAPRLEPKPQPAPKALRWPVKQPLPALEDDDEVTVTPVAPLELPSIDQFRRR